MKTAFSTIKELLVHRAVHSREAVAFLTGNKSYTCGWLLETSRRFAAKLQLEGVKSKETILILVPNSAEFFIAFYGCMICGAIAVPIFPNAGIDRSSQIAHLSNSRHIILPEKLNGKREQAFIEWALEKNILIHRVAEAISSGHVTSFPPVNSNDVAFIQYTSGSSGFPKGVPITHRQLLINIEQMTEALAITNDDVFVSWLPVYHDMGLILNTMVPLYTGALLVLLQEGLHRIHSWLKTIEQYKATVISAPDVAYRLCVKGVKNPAIYDLSSLRIALNASEPVHLETYQLFEESFNLKQVMIAGYGLAEATVAVTIHPPTHPPRVDESGNVSSGLPLKGIDVRIEKTDHLPGKTGEILVRSPAAMKNYFNKSKTINPFTNNGYLRTGDLGYLDQEGYLFILGRKKNIVKQAGKTLYPHDVEQTVNSLEGIRKSAAIGIKQLAWGGESLFVFAESWHHKNDTLEKYHKLVIDIVQKVYDHFGIRPGKVFILKQKSLPHTPNGKLKHAELKNNYLHNFPLIDRNILYPRGNQL